MINVYDFYAPDLKLTSPAITIGMFDGVHRGHQILLEEVKKFSQTLGGQSVVITFARHPLEVLNGKGPGAILPLHKRIELLHYYGINVCLIIDFNADIARIQATEFIRDLSQRIGMKAIIAGQDFRFGHQGKGNFELLQSLGLVYNYQTKIIPFNYDGCNKISSTRIRQTIWDGDLYSAYQLLGRPFSLIGEVISGRQRGRDLGFPTANLKLHHHIHPPDGVYAGAAHIQNKNYLTLISIGTCPTFGQEDLKIEVYILDYQGDLYGQTFETQVYERIRDQITFPNATLLCQQIESDRLYMQSHWKLNTDNCESYATKLIEKSA